MGVRMLHAQACWKCKHYAAIYSSCSLPIICDAGISIISRTPHHDRRPRDQARKRTHRRRVQMLRTEPRADNTKLHFTHASFESDPASLERSMCVCSS